MMGLILLGSWHTIASLICVCLLIKVFGKKIAPRHRALLAVVLHSFFVSTFYSFDIHQRGFAEVTGMGTVFFFGTAPILAVSFFLLPAVVSYLNRVPAAGLPKEPHPIPPSDPLPTPLPKPGLETANPDENFDFSKRNRAALIDSGILFFIFLTMGAFGLPKINIIVLSVLYFSFLEGFSKQSFGKKLAGIQAVDSFNKPLSFTTSLKRSLCLQLSLLAWGAGYWSAYSDPERRTWHDKWTGTKVVNAEKKPGGISDFISGPFFYIGAILLVIVLYLFLPGKIVCAGEGICMTNLAESRDDIAVCDSIADEAIREHCLHKVIRKKNTKACDQLQDHYAEKYHAHLATCWGLRPESPGAITFCNTAQGKGNMRDLVEVSCYKKLGPNFRVKEKDDTFLHAFAKIYEIRPNEISNVEFKLSELVRAGADPMNTDKEGNTPLHLSLNVDFLKYVLGSSLAIDLNKKNSIGDTPLLSWAKRGCNLRFIEGTLKVMLEKGVNLDAQDNEGKTALHRCLQRNPNRELVELFSRYGADLYKVDQGGKTPSQILKDQSLDPEKFGFMSEHKPIN